MQRSTTDPPAKSFTTALCESKDLWERGGLSYAEKGGAALCAAAILRIGFHDLYASGFESALQPFVRYAPEKGQRFRFRMTSEADSIINKATAAAKK